MLFLYLVVVNYVHLRFLGLPLDLWGVGGGGWFAKSFLGSMLTVFINIRPTKVVNHTSCIMHHALQQVGG